MGKALYREHRPKKLAEVIGQEHITETLTQALKQGNISHAYLFTGPRGVGKTSIARILAHEINNLPYDDDSMHLDIIEIDAASNRRIDEIRDLRDKVHVAPTSATYKIYIIDEVHMLTREAFNALLKTLEEPPAHVIFILATTDAHKVPETITSRTQRFTFRPVGRDKVAAHLKTIATAERITVTDGALDILAEHGEGSFRDSISLLDQAASHGQKLDERIVQNLLGIPPVEALQSLLSNLANHSAASVIMKQLSELYGHGFQATTVAKQLAAQIRHDLTVGASTFEGSVALRLLEQLLEVPVAHDPESYLEIVVLSLSHMQPAVTPIIAEPTPAPVTPAAEVRQAEPKPASVITPPKQVTPARTESVKTQSPVAEALAFNQNLWPQILQALKQRYNTLYGVVRMAEPTFQPDENLLRLAFGFAFHQKRVNEAANRKILSDTVYELTGQNISLECVFDKQATPAKTATTAPPVGDGTNLKAISNIFGGGELLES